MAGDPFALATYLVSGAYTDSGEVFDWLVYMSEAQADELREKLEASDFYDEVYVGQPGAPVSYDHFRQVSNFYEEEGE